TKAPESTRNRHGMPCRAVFIGRGPHNAKRGIAQLPICRRARSGKPEKNRQVPRQLQGVDRFEERHGREKDETVEQRVQEQLRPETVRVDFVVKGKIRDEAWHPDHVGLVGRAEHLPEIFLLAQKAEKRRLAGARRLFMKPGLPSLNAAPAPSSSAGLRAWARPRPWRCPRLPRAPCCLVAYRAPYGPSRGRDNAG